MGYEDKRRNMERTSCAGMSSLEVDPVYGRTKTTKMDQAPRYEFPRLLRIKRIWISQYTCFLTQLFFIVHRWLSFGSSFRSLSPERESCKESMRATGSSSLTKDSLPFASLAWLGGWQSRVTTITPRTKLRTIRFGTKLALAVSGGELYTLLLKTHVVFP